MHLYCTSLWNDCRRGESSPCARTYFLDCPLYNKSVGHDISLINLMDHKHEIEWNGGRSLLAIKKNTLGIFFVSDFFWIVIWKTIVIENLGAKALLIWNHDSPASPSPYAELFSFKLLAIFKKHPLVLHCGLGKLCDVSLKCSLTSLPELIQDEPVLLEHWGFCLKIQGQCPKLNQFKWKKKVGGSQGWVAINPSRETWAQ